MTDFVLHLGDCLEHLRTLPEDSIDAVVTDPPYGLGSVRCLETLLRSWLKGGDGLDAVGSGGFMGKSWDATVPPPSTWAECLRVLKPGGHLLAFAGPRTQDLMGLSIRLGGFEVRDSLHWVYGSGFPKSLNIPLAIDKAMGVERERLPPKRLARSSHCLSASGFNVDGYQAPSREAVSREAVSREGYGTALKPAHEPIILARKPLAESSIARQVLATGTGGINVDGCRVQGDDAVAGRSRHGGGLLGGSSWQLPDSRSEMPSGRWPPNLLLSHLPECEDPGPCAEGCAVRELDQQSDDASRVFSCFRYQAKPSKAEREEGTRRLEEKTRNRVNPGGLENDPRWAPVKRRNIHPTVKPVELMRWLVRLVTPPGGVVLDPFTGSGTTGVAALREGFRFHGCERDEDYHAIALARIEWEAEHPLAKAAAKAEEANPGQLTLFTPPAEREGEG